MKRLVDVDGTLVHQLLDRLEGASIAASALPVVTYRGAPHPSGLFTVSVSDDCDLAAARRIAEDFLRSTAAATTEAVCPNCDYDLSGHHGSDRCPECGEAVVASSDDITCGNCGEEVPGTFGACWNCGSEVGRAAAPGEG
ncbi:MAG: zinc ribbon domain-containing protein [Planctomycetota bacterium]|jgi:hypothetical protein